MSKLSVECLCILCQLRLTDQGVFSLSSLGWVWNLWSVVELQHKNHLNKTINRSCLTLESFPHTLVSRCLDSLDLLLIVCPCRDT